jgi:fluoride exporter
MTVPRRMRRAVNRGRLWLALEEAQALPPETPTKGRRRDESLHLRVAHMYILLAIAIAGAIGSVLRYLIGGAVHRALHVGFPLGTLFVNVAGCVLVGMLARHYLNDETEPVLRAALMVGFCGGFTTFSTFSLEAFGLFAAGHWPKAAAYVLASTVLCLAGTAAGYQLVLRR